MHVDPNSYNRRRFLKHSLAGAAGILGLQVLSSCSNDPLAGIKGSIVGANNTTGHLLRDISKLPAPSEEIATDILIIGGGIAGLSARRWLHRLGVENVTLLEMDAAAGGNAAYGNNAVSAYPWGAHYLPVPDNRNQELLQFLEEANVITGYNDHGLPVYNEYHLCHEPEERLYIRGHWQEGLVPEFGVPAEERRQIGRFFQAMDAFRAAKGKDGRDAFAIPVDISSSDETYRSLDRTSMREYMRREGYTSPHLLWYVEYGCKDDYGCSLANTSAWAGIHYFASRKGMAANATSSDVLTWPEGNGYLMNRLRQGDGGAIATDRLVFSVRRTATGGIAHVYDVQGKRTTAINARKIILATPQFVTRRLLQDWGEPGRNTIYDSFKYAPWGIANITINGLPDTKGIPLCWDNVFYGRKSVGYVNANHQDLGQKSRKVLTCYYPLVDDDPAIARQKAHGMQYRDWLKLFIGELEFAHQGITKFIEHADVWIWGHGMIAPGPSFIWSAQRQLAMQSVDDTLYFAHSDLSGISIFEEAFYQGIRAANEIVSTL